MMFPEGSEGGSTAPESALPPEPAPTQQEVSSEPAKVPESNPNPAPELSLREKIQKSAEKALAQRQKEAKSREKAPETPASTTTPPPVAADGKKPVEGAPTPFAPTFKLKVMDQEREIPKILQPLMKDEATSKEIKELVEKAYGLEYVKPKLDEARTQLQAATGEIGQWRTQIQNARQLFARGDIGGWLKALDAPAEKVLQWVADQLDYQKLPQEQRVILDARKQAEERAFAAEQRAGSVQMQHEQLLTQQVQVALDSCLARPEVDAVAQAYDTRVGKPGSFKAEVNRRGDYIWRTENRVAPPEQLVRELMGIVGPVAPQSAPAAASPAAPAAVATAAPAAPAPKVPTIPNISGRSVSALPSKVKSISDLRAKHKELQDARRG